MAACSSSEEADPASESDELSQRATEYTCRIGTARILESAEMKVTVADGHMRFVDVYGPNTGERDRSYRAPTNTQRVRYDGFEYGGDCNFRIVMDASALRGAASPQMRVQCSTDEEFMQDLYTCDSPRATRLNVRPPGPVTPPPPVVPSRDAKKWDCISTEGRILEDSVTLQIEDAGMRLVADDLEYEGVRDRDYRSRAGSWFEYEDFDYGGDCTMTAVVEQKILQPGTTSAKLKVRCAGDDFTQDTYTCKPQQ